MRVIDPFPSDITELAEAELTTRENNMELAEAELDNFCCESIS